MLRLSPQADIIILGSTPQADIIIFFFRLLYFSNFLLLDLFETIFILLEFIKVLGSFLQTVILNQNKEFTETFIIIIP